MDSLVQAADVAIRRTAVVRATMRADGVADWLRGAFERVLRTLERQRIRPNGPPFARYTRRGELVEVEAGFPVEEPIDDDGDVVASGLPAGPAATVTHTGDVTGLDNAYRRINTWLKQHGFAVAGPHWEYYQHLDGDKRRAGHWRVDVVVPYRWR